MSSEDGRPRIDRRAQLTILASVGADRDRARI
jgi:hypothetical protein